MKWINNGILGMLFSGWFRSKVGQNLFKDI